MGRRAKGEGSISEHKPTGLWRYSIDVGKSAQGKRQRLVLYAKSKTELLRRVHDEKARAGGTLGARAIGTLGDWVTTWLADEVKPNRSASTWVSYETCWRLHVAPLIGHVALDGLDVDTVLHLMRKLRAAGTSASMIDRVLRILHRALAVAIRHGRYTRANPFAQVDRPTVAPREMRSLSVAEAKRFVAACASDRYEALWIVLLTCGLRLGEALGLRWSDVDFKRRTISVQRSRSEVGDDGPGDKDTKNRSSRRTLNFGKLAEDALLRRRAAAKAEGHGADAIFCTLRGTVVLRSNLRRRHFAPILAAAKITNLRVHDLRHSHASLGLASGVTVRAMSDRLGHATTKMTMERYAHALSGMDRAAATAIDAAIAPKRRR